MSAPSRHLLAVATATAGLGRGDAGMGALLVDLDGDGDLDLYCANYGRDRLFLPLDRLLVTNEAYRYTEGDSSLMGLGLPV